MITFFIILAAIIVTVLLAYAIVNYIPKKLHWIISIILIALAIFLVYKINFEVTKPIKFNKEKKVKYAKVIKVLKILRDAEVAHKRVTGNYTNNGANLIAFIDTAQFAVTQTKNVPKTIHLGGGITKEVEERVVDTVGYEPVKDLFKGKDYKNMLQIPGTNQQFKIETSIIEKFGTIKTPVFEIKVDKALILKGMDYNLINQEKDAIGGDDIKGAFVKVGSLDDVSEDGNWPPFYDKGDKQNTDE
ncbi:hypothetical protein [Lutibacter sp.]|uniref:hypothetical protein n=1 Tax=Lutibacter sp. TaxID=1925666 RepID=UPI0025B7B761|nr:hypothetical protein [Lutibacter sp.]MCF6181876.1 hypothetical protein [Lutibacter sp.]